MERVVMDHDMVELLGVGETMASRRLGENVPMRRCRLAAMAPVLRAPLEFRSCPVIPARPGRRGADSRPEP